MICLLSFSGLNAQNDPVFEDALKLTKYSQSGVEASFDQIYQMVPQEKHEALRKDLEPIMAEIMEMTAKIMTKYYNHEEIKAMLQFYESEIGQKMLKNQGAIMSESLSNTSELTEKVMEIMSKYM